MALRRKNPAERARIRARCQVAWQVQQITEAAIAPGVTLPEESA